MGPGAVCIGGEAVAGQGQTDRDPCPQCEIRRLCPGMEHVSGFFMAELPFVSFSLLLVSCEQSPPTSLLRGLPCSASVGLRQGAHCPQGAVPWLFWVEMWLLLLAPLRGPGCGSQRGKRREEIDSAPWHAAFN